MDRSVRLGEAVTQESSQKFFSRHTPSQMESNSREIESKCSSLLMTLHLRSMSQKRELRLEKSLNSTPGQGLHLQTELKLYHQDQSTIQQLSINIVQRIEKERRKIRSISQKLLTRRLPSSTTQRLTMKMRDMVADKTSNEVKTETPVMIQGSIRVITRMMEVDMKRQLQRKWCPKKLEFPRMIKQEKEEMSLILMIPVTLIQ